MRDIDLLQHPAGFEIHCLIRFLQTHLVAAFLKVDGTVLSCTEKYQLLFGSNNRFDELVHPDDLHQDTQLKQELLIGQLQEFRLEKRLFDQNGEERWFEIETSLLQPGDGSTEPIVAIVLNEITENRKMYDAMLWNERRWRELINQSGLLFFQCDIEANLFYFTPRITELLGIQLDEWITQPITELIHPEDLDAFEVFFNKSLQGDTASVICRFKNQRANWLEFRLKAQIDPTETGIILHAQDLSEQFTLAEQTQFYRAQYKTLLIELSQMLSI